MLIYSAKLFECEIYSNTELTQNIYITRFVNRDLILNCYPGQFINLRVNDSLTPLLRRPFSICQVNEKEGWFEILWQVSGQGTAIMKNYQAGDKVNVLGPLGSGFKIPVKINNAILVGGGLGLAPLPYLCKKLLEKNIKVEIFVGVRTRADLAMMTPFTPFDVPVEVATED